MPETTHVDRIFSLLTQQDEITWQTILYDLVRKEGMDPWDVDISLIARRYIELIRKLKEHDFRLSGKVLLAAAILLKLKSSKLVDEDITELDRLIRGEEEGTSDDLLFEEPGAYRREELGDISLMPRTPQPRKRKVSIFDLVKALEKALEVKHRRVHNQMPAQPLAPHKKSRDITELIREIYGRIRVFFGATPKGKLTFQQLLPSDSREDKVHTFIPLLHLSQQRKVDLSQEEPFGEIGVSLAVKEELKEEMAEEKT
ncbi:segregation/condensation protein A [Candidatus Woesearchaeota archaeon]|nr:segregation/condensation protein A [Candidatus Woesearchaeota archaeon]QBM01090.1 segregation and condensation protein A [uncultured archaeon]